MNELNGIIKTKGNLVGTVNTNVKTKAAVSVGGTLISSNTSKRGIPGTDGFSPSATVTKEGGVATITITDKDGTTTADIYDGSGGGASAFIAEFNVTPYADVKDAYDEDAIIFCERNVNDSTYLLPLLCPDEEGESFYFGSGNVEGFIFASISTEGGWQGGTVPFATKDTATTSMDGLMSSSDKSKLNGIASGAEVNVNADWNAVSGDAQILNKPTIPSNLSDLNNDMDVSDFPNDAGYLTTETDPTVPSWAKQASKPSYTAAEVGAVPTTRKVNGKALSADISLTATDVSALPASTSIPSKTSDLTNDSGFLTAETDPVFTASAAHGISASDISNWNGKDTVSVSRHTTSGTNIADITISGTTTKLYAPSGGGGGGTITDVTVDGTSIVDDGVAELETVTQLRDGLMTATDKQKLDGIASGAEANVQSDWNQSNTSADDYIKNKPTIPTVNNATLTIQKNGSTVNTFSANASSNVTANITVPTDTDDLTNGAGYITSSALPTKVSDLANDAGYITGYTETDPTVPSWAKQNTKPSYTASEVGALPDTTTIPSKTSDLTNDSGFISAETDPVFSASASSGITSTDISNWNNGKLSLDTSAATGTTDGDLYAAIVALGWASDVIE